VSEYFFLNTLLDIVAYSVHNTRCFADVQTSWRCMLTGKS